MTSRIAFAVISVFFVVMNALLWRSEFGDKDHGAALPVSVVWEKILSAPDDSHLEVIHKGKRIGSFRWSANALEAAATGKVANPDEIPEGQIKKISGYTIDIAEGALFMDDKAKRLKFQMSSEFTAQHTWKKVEITAVHKPTVFEITASSADESLHFKVREDRELFERRLTFAEMRQPEKLLQELGESMQARLLVGALTGGMFFSQDKKNFSLGLAWEARNDTLRIGSSRLRVYRLQARLFDRYQIVAYISQIGRAHV